VSVYDERPWLARYRDGQASEFTPAHPSALAMFAASVRAAPDTPVVKYFDGTITLRELDEMSDAFAASLLANGFERGDRLAVYLQNVPQFLIAMVATWKAGGIMVSVNPMSRHRELSYLLEDSGASVLVCLESLYGGVAKDVVGDTAVRLVVTTSELEYQTRNDPRLFAGVERVRHGGTYDMAELIAAHRGETPPPVELASGDVAFLTYTSGTTGTPKGAMNTHGNVVFNAQTFQDWVDLTPADSVLGIAPLFHITGLIAHIAVALLVPMPLVLAYRFEPGVVLDALREHRPTFTVGSITVFIALMNAPGMRPDEFASLSKIFSGGAPIAPSTVARFRELTGHYIHNVYGLTETTSPSHGVPLGGNAPVDPTSGALSVGVPIFNTVVRIVGEDDKDLPVGEVGEIVTEGPQVVVGYWNKPEETEKALPAGRLHTGDVGFMDKDGWFYIVDRKKDMINAAGYKVWPREVEDVLYEHPAVLEAAVIGIPDAYRGETVKAYVSLRPGATADPDELRAFAKERMAAYKYPRTIEIIDELPKTVTGKVLRRELRERAGAAATRADSA
jgi:long-chain acyl-CoA synthetase